MSFLSTINQAYLAQISVDSSVKHMFCGEHAIEGARCPNCNKALLRFLSIDTSDPLIASELQSTVKQIHLLFCWTCNISQVDFYYQLNLDGSVSLLQFGIGGVETDFPYEDYPDHFPFAPIELIRIPDDIVSLFISYNDGKSIYPDPLYLGRAVDIPIHQSLSGSN